MKPIIEINKVSKKYQIGAKQPYLTLRDSLSLNLGSPHHAESNSFWALKDISLKVMPGEVVGIIGGNGAGKSTLLKILSRITPPTSGEVILRGGVSSLLEVGTGFSPELTGRENIFLNGAILGMTRNLIQKRFDEIVAFSGVEKFLDTPVKRFSSGMYVRLAFAVAAHLDSEILVLDEVLSVGDSEFQKKSMAKLESATKSAGRTILFVSHNLNAVQRLCKRSLLLERGRVKIIGDTKTVIDTYLGENPNSFARSHLIQGNLKDFKFTGIKITNHNGSSLIKSDDRLQLVLKYASNFKESIPDARVIITILNDSSQFVLRLDSDVTVHTFDHNLKARGEIICETESINLSEGKYFVNINFSVQDTDKDCVERAGTFEVTTDPKVYDYKYYPNKSISNHLIKYRFR